MHFNLEHYLMKKYVFCTSTVALMKFVILVKSHTSHPVFFAFSCTSHIVIPTNYFPRTFSVQCWKFKHVTPTFLIAHLASEAINKAANKIEFNDSFRVPINKIK